MRGLGAALILFAWSAGGHAAARPRWARRAPSAPRAARASPAGRPSRAPLALRALEAAQRRLLEALAARDVDGAASAQLRSSRLVREIRPALSARGRAGEILAAELRREVGLEAVALRARRLDEAGVAARAAANEARVGERALP